MTGTDWIALGAIAAVVTAVGTVAMALAIIVTAIYAKGSLAATRDDSRARTRPVIVAELHRELLSHGTILLALRNFGASVATDVSVTFDPPPPSDIESLPMSDMWGWIYRRFQLPITTWSPGWATSNVVRTGEDPLDDFKVTVNYFGADKTPYQDVFYLHPAHALNETTSNPSTVSDPIKLEQQKVSALQALVRTVRANS